eukprot:CAMPEP_0118943480 /NCGR_PEP_ID=MMETSP1169-20130426/38402_1 /TAXON_ID=36882 /ORGANISM="Pyramimonas obovata, Strain CCMP722" /LENGTH=260 /DNA_ID=CAMNT_0006888745 /DNA_START=87 /DNA_END=866 /DNA_ORIENTATION=+
MAPKMEEEEMFYRLKWVDFMGNRMPIVLQNENGPCPLLAVANILLLRGAISLRSGTSDVSHTELLTLVTNKLLEANDKAQNMGDEYKRNVEHNVADAINLLPKLATGLDVNVRFRNIDDFEFTQECAIFDLLDIQLVHGWLVSPEDEIAAVIGSKSYNELITMVCSSAPTPTANPGSNTAPPSDVTSEELIKETTDSIALDFGDDEQKDQEAELQKALTMSLEGASAEELGSALSGLSEAKVILKTSSQKALLAQGGRPG